MTGLWKLGEVYCVASPHPGPVSSAVLWHSSHGQSPLNAPVWSCRGKESISPSEHVEGEATTFIWVRGLKRKQEQPFSPFLGFPVCPQVTELNPGRALWWKWGHSIRRESWIKQRESCIGFSGCLESLSLGVWPSYQTSDPWGWLSFHPWGWLRSPRWPDISRTLECSNCLWWAQLCLACIINQLEWSWKSPLY